MLPKPKYRILWTWDMPSNWDSSVNGKPLGCSGKNFRRAAFLGDYKRMVDYASAHHFNGIVIWGAVRAHNDGVAQLKELVKYGRERGVRILPGVSAFSYGGVFYDPTTVCSMGHDRAFGEHPYSLHTWLTKHPEYAAVDPDGKPYPFGPLNILACPSRRENIQWFREALAWLYDEFDIDGIQVEVGDYSVCHCDLCRARRKAESTDKAYAVDDMAETYNAAMEVSLAKKPDAWVLCETYSCLSYPFREESGRIWPHMPDEDRRQLAVLPPQAILQWSNDRALGEYATQRIRPDGYLPLPNNILRIHSGSQWSQNGPADWAANLVWDLVRQARTNGINGVSLFGEESFFAPPNEANYLALEEASGFGAPNEALDEQLFYSRTLDPLYGGSGMTARWRSLYLKGRMLLIRDRLQKPFVLSAQPYEKLTDDPDFRRKALTFTDAECVQALDRFCDEAHALGATLSGETCRRWAWLENQLWQIRYNIATRP